MTTSAPPLPTAPSDDPLAPERRGFWRSALHVVIFSLAVTATAAMLATITWLFSSVSWPIAFVILRWIFVAILLATPLVHQLLIRTGSNRVLPWALRTPATALVLTIESIGFDILSARLTD